jgi:hypothetical protein
MGQLPLQEVLPKVGKGSESWLKNSPERQRLTGSYSSYVAVYQMSIYDEAYL